MHPTRGRLQHRRGLTHLLGPGRGLAVVYPDGARAFPRERLMKLGQRRPPRCPDRSPPRRPGYNDALRIARQNLDSHPNYILAVYMASGT